VQVADHAIGSHYPLAIQPENDTQYAVRRRVLRTHVENQFVAVEEGGSGSGLDEIRH
jgi:hypothetical protein